MAARMISALAVDPAGIGGLWLRARSSPLRQTVLDALGSVLPYRRIAPTISSAQLTGGLNISETISTGQQVFDPGILETETVVALSMAERASRRMAGQIAQWIDTEEGCLIALDEGAEPDERLAGALADRLGLYLDLDGVGQGELSSLRVSKSEIEQARDHSPALDVPHDLHLQAVLLCAQFGCSGLRGPLRVISVARALAALDAANKVTDAHLAEAASYVLPARALCLPEEADAPEPEDTQLLSDDTPADGGDEMSDGGNMEKLVDAVTVHLPEDALNLLQSQPPKQAKSAGTGTGSRAPSTRRGRPLSARPGRLNSSERIDLVATLRAAAPWQKLRRDACPDRDNLHLRPGDIRVKRYEACRDRVLIFCVDASGSAAMQRMAEAKGAIELLLAQAYARRDHVALVAFRGDQADELLPPTRSLVQTKRRLAHLPAGGGTPLAAGIETGFRVALTAERHALTPTIIILTDGRANIARDGSADRAKAAQDAQTISSSVRVAGLPALVIDTGNRPSRQLEDLSSSMGARYMPLPRADARRLSNSVAQALDH